MPSSSPSPPSPPSPHHDDNNIHVYLRIRPMNLLEESRRSRHCITFHDDDPTSISITSPHEGSCDVTFDRVFDETTSQSEVYASVGESIPKALLEGYNCALIGYGQTGTGKTHTMMGVGNNVASTVTTATTAEGREDATTAATEDPSLRSSTTNSNAKGTNGDSSPPFNDGETLATQEEEDNDDSGLMLRVIRDLYLHMRKSCASREFTIRCSYVEIYLERILDLLSPSARNLTVVDDDDEEEEGRQQRLCSGEFPYVRNASEACCFDESDVVSLLVRGNATRMMSMTKMNTDGSRSHAIFTILLEQKDTVTGSTITSRLQMVDLAGSEIGSTANKKTRGTVATMSASGQNTFQAQETAMIKRSFTALNGVMKVLMERQKLPDDKQPSGGDIDVPYHASQLTRLLKDAFGGNCRTTLMLTASPSSYTISETMNTLRFGQRARRIENRAIIKTQKSVGELTTELGEMRNVVRALTNEYNELKEEHDIKDDNDSPLWKDVAAILSNDEKKCKRDSLTEAMTNYNDDKKKTNVQKLDEAQAEIERLKHELQQEKKGRINAERSLAEVQSTVTILRSQNETLTKEKTAATRDAQELKNNVESLTSQKSSLETELHTAQFRGNEAVIFLRQFRIFYRRLLRNKASQGTGDTFDILTKMVGIPDLSDLIDIDVVLYESGLIEEEEMYDTESLGSNYTPTSDAMRRSSKAAFNHDFKSEEILKDNDFYTERSRLGVFGRSSSKEEGSSETGSNNDEKNPTDPARTSPPPTDNDEEPESDIVIPTTSLSRSHREQQLNTDLRRMTERCIDLQVKLDHEKANVDVLTTRSGSVSYKRLAQESVGLREALDRKTHDMQALIWKLNELHVINKTYKEKMTHRDQHVTYLEEALLDLQNKVRTTVMDKQESEAKLREEMENFRTLADAITVPLWQFGECPVMERSLANRIMIPIRGTVGVETNETADNIEIKMANGTALGTSSSILGSIGRGWRASDSDSESMSSLNSKNYDDGEDDDAKVECHGLKKHLLKKKRKLKQKEEQIRLREEEVNVWMVEIEKKAKMMEDKEMEFEKTAVDLAEKEELIRTIEEKLQETEEDMKEWEKEIKIKEDEVLDKVDELNEREEKLDEIEFKLEEKITRLKESEEKFRRLQLELQGEFATAGESLDRRSRITEYLEEEEYSGSESETDDETVDGDDNEDDNGETKETTDNKQNNVKTESNITPVAEQQQTTGSSSPTLLSGNDLSSREALLRDKESQLKTKETELKAREEKILEGEEELKYWELELQEKETELREKNIKITSREKEIATDKPSDENDKTTNDGLTGKNEGETALNDKQQPQQHQTDEHYQRQEEMLKMTQEALTIKEDALKMKEKALLRKEDELILKERELKQPATDARQSMDDVLTQREVAAVEERLRSGDMEEDLDKSNVEVRDVRRQEREGSYESAALRGAKELLDKEHRHEDGHPDKMTKDATVETDQVQAYDKLRKFEEELNQRESEISWREEEVFRKELKLERSASQDDDASIEMPRDKTTPKHAAKKEQEDSDSDEETYNTMGNSMTEEMLMISGEDDHLENEQARKKSNKHDEDEKVIAQKQMELQTREEVLKYKSDALIQLQEEIEKEQHVFAEKMESLETKRKEIDDKVKELDETAAALVTKEAALASKEESLVEVQTRLDELERQKDTENDDVEKIKREMEDKVRLLQENDQRLESKECDIAKKVEDLKARERVLEEREDYLQKREQDVQLLRGSEGEGSEIVKEKEEVPEKERLAFIKKQEDIEKREKALKDSEELIQKTNDDLEEKKEDYLNNEKLLKEWNKELEAKDEEINIREIELRKNEEFLKKWEDDLNLKEQDLSEKEVRLWAIENTSQRDVPTNGRHQRRAKTFCSLSSLF